VRPGVTELREGEPRAVVLENARRKAQAGLELAGGGDQVTVIGADTDVAIDGRLLGKPEDEAGARARLETLSGRAHDVLGGLVVLTAGDPAVEHSGVASSAVRFARLEPETIDLYLASGEWRDRAGAYAIQGLGSILIDELRGDFSNVVGLPLALLLQLTPNLVRVFPKP
jgi:septum formation protein